MYKRPIILLSLSRINPESCQKNCPESFAASPDPPGKHQWITAFGVQRPASVRRKAENTLHGLRHKKVPPLLFASKRRYLKKHCNSISACISYSHGMALTVTKESCLLHEERSIMPSRRREHHAFTKKEVSCLHEKGSIMPSRRREHILLPGE